MAQFIDLSGQLFGITTALRRTTNSKAGRTRFICRCDCGRTHIAHASNLRDGQTKSCGCLPPPNQLAYGESGLNRKFRSMKYRAKKRNNIVEITRDEFYMLSQLNCHYCDSIPNQVCTEGFGKFIYNGLDRINSAKNYTLDNIVPCCGRCNEMKMHYSQEEFYNHIIKIIKHRNLKVE